MGDDVFQPDELVDLFRVALSNEFKENSNFCFVNVDIEEFNDVLSSNRHTQVNEDDNDEINIQDCDGDKDNSIDEWEDNSN
ncbi:hypothetical protein Peur_008491 [Populus x canadensis]